MYVCMYVCMHACMHACILVYICAYVLCMYGSYDDPKIDWLEADPFKWSVIIGLV